jgi:two-component system phosphate regulon sensor histidine kinase PhoR
MLSYRNQLLAGFALVVIGLLVGGYIVFRGAVGDSVLQQARKAAEEELKTVEYALRQSEETGSKQALREMLNDLGRRSNARLSLLDAEGRILVDTALPSAELDEVQTERPEIEEAVDGGTGRSIRYSPPVHLKFLFVAREVKGLVGVETGYLRLGKSFGPIRDRIDSGTARFFWLLVMAAVLLCPVYAFLSRRLSREIGRITLDVDSMGRNAGRASEATLREFSPMVRNINKISEQTYAYLQKISMQRDEVEAILDTLADGVAVLDSRGRIRRYNRAMAKIVRSQQDLTGRMPIECIPSTELQDEVEEMLVAGKQTDVARSLYVTFYDQSHFEATLLPHLFHQVQSTEIILVLHDVTELKRLEQARKDFVANVSHELRTPITSIKGYTETLLHSPPTDSQTLNSFMGIVARNVENLDRLVDNLIYLSRAEASEESGGSLEEEVDLGQVLDAAWQVCAPLAQRKGVVPERETPREQVPLVKGNTEQLIRVMLNLLDNAIKYSPEGERVGVRIEDLGSQWQVTVEDSGPGIPPGLQARIFERFYRGDAGRSNAAVHGTGLGLSICKHILHRHGGEITVQSPVPGGIQGARFAFSLPKHDQKLESSGKE